MTEWSAPAVAKLVEENKKLRALVVALLTETAPAAPTPSPAPPIPEQGSGPGWPVPGRVYGPAPGRPDPFRPNMDAPPGVADDHPGREQDNGTAQPAGDPSGYPVGTVVTDSRTRPCKLEEGGWYRPGTPGLIPWSEVVDAKGGYDMAESLPGTPHVVYQPQQRAQVPMRVARTSTHDVVVDHVLLDAQGEPMHDDAGRPRLTHQKERLEIQELEPDPDVRS